ncbi:hypothetical protein chiPu_0022828, partial [Chiloscyllium punctatum]|nr:hypothetical protein [Chiloscyllium punctatum]
SGCLGISSPLLPPSDFHIGLYAVIPGALATTTDIGTRHVLVRQEKLEHLEHIQREREVHERVMAQRAEQRFRKHYSLCQEVVNHIIDLVTKIAEYRELTL